MYIFIAFLTICAVAIPVAYIRERNRSRQVEKEKNEGKWDFIDYQYLPYLQSFGEVEKIDNVSFKIDYRSYGWTLTGTLYFNKAGIYAKLAEVTGFSAPTQLFVWGKVNSGRFKALNPLYFRALEEQRADTLFLKLNTKETGSDSDYTLKISKLPPGVIGKLKSIFTEG